MRDENKDLQSIARYIKKKKHARDPLTRYTGMCQELGLTGVADGSMGFYSCSITNTHPAVFL